MLLIIFIMVFITVSPVYGKHVPEWVRTNITEPYMPVSKETDAALLYSDTQIGCRNGIITSQEKRLYHILRLEGQQYGSLYLDLLKGTKVSGLKGFRLNASGDLLETLQKKNIHHTAFSEQLHDDARQLFAHFKNIDTGDYAAFEYEIAQEPFFKTALYSFGDRIEIAVKHIRIPDGAACVILNDPDNTIEKSGSTYTTRTQPAIDVEENGPSFKERIPFIGIIYEPDTDNSWISFSRQFWKLTQDIPRLSDASGQDLQFLLTIRNREEFIRRTLNHVSETVRYIAIAVGDGRIIPSPVDLVHSKKYGDCKDMTYYALAILKEGGVTAWPVLAQTKSNGPVFESFPAFQFNHAIIAVELDADSSELKNIEFDGRPYLIADLTDKYTAPPMIQPALENTKILPITKNGSSLVTLAGASAGKTLKKQAVHWTFHADRSADITLTETVSGHFASQTLLTLDSIKKQKEDEMYRKRVQGFVPGADMTHVSVEYHPETVVTRYEFTAQNMGTDLDKKLYLIPNIIQADAVGYRRRNRESDLVIPFYYSRQVDITVDIDSAYRIESIPETNELENDYFSASCSANRQGNQVSVTVLFSWKTDRITPGQYTEFRQLFQDYLKMAKSQIVLSSDPWHSEP